MEPTRWPHPCARLFRTLPDLLRIRPLPRPRPRGRCRVFYWRVGAWRRPGRWLGRRQAAQLPRVLEGPHLDLRYRPCPGCRCRTGHGCCCCCCCGRCSQQPYPGRHPPRPPARRRFRCGRGIPQREPIPRARPWRDGDVVRRPRRCAHPRQRRLEFCERLHFSWRVRRRWRWCLARASCPPRRVRSAQARAHQAGQHSARRRRRRRSRRCWRGRRPAYPGSCPCRRLGPQPGGSGSVPGPILRNAGLHPRRSIAPSPRGCMR